ncbi:MAG: hypothetical protein ACR2G4_16025 [Pyrinomonadaceae bacterium]
MVVFFCFLFIAIGIGCLFLAFNKHSRREAAEQSWYWLSAKNKEDKETAEAMAMFGPLFAGILIISGAVAVLLIWLLK